MIGDPVRHSLSPALHNAAFAELGLDWTYLAFPIPKGSAAEAIEAMRLFGIEGMSVTMPHKADVARAVDARTAVVDLLEVCNCVFRDGDLLVGDSTDGDGFVRSLLVDDGIDLNGARVMVVGTGGAASSIVEALGRSGCAEVVVTSRSQPRAEHTCRLAPMARPGSVDELGLVDVIVNASPVGMTGGPDAMGIPVPVGLLGEQHIVVDIVYQPRETPLLAAATARGARAINGVGMLVHQAALSFERWTKHAAPIEAMRAAAFPDG